MLGTISLFTGLEWFLILLAIAAIAAVLVFITKWMKKMEKSLKKPTKDAKNMKTAFENVNKALNGDDCDKLKKLYEAAKKALGDWKSAKSGGLKPTAPEAQAMDAQLLIIKKAIDAKCS